MKIIDTPRGARIRLTPAPPHLGEGVLMRLSMQSAADGRACEIFLDAETKAELSEALKEEDLWLSTN